MGVPAVTVRLMQILLHIVVPSATPTPFLSVVGSCFLWSFPASLLVILVIRFGWRRGKGMEDL
jgi:hypothetical protein